MIFCKSKIASTSGSDDALNSKVRPKQRKISHRLINRVFSSYCMVQTQRHILN